jgi:type I restriction enzyme S subunit
MSWPLVKIGEICTLTTGGTPKTSISEYYENGTVPWIVSGDIHKGKIFDCDKRITELAVENSNARVLPKDSVLIALNGQGKTRGTVALLRSENATCNQSIVSINPNDKDELFSDFLFCFLKSQYKQIRNLTGDKDRAGLNMPLIRGIEIPLPPIDKQKRIAAILDKADAIRRKRQETLTLTENLIQSTFIDMFGDPKLNPKSLPKKPLGDLIKVKSGNGLTAKEMSPNGQHPVYGGNGINGYHNAYMFDERQIVIGRVGVYCGAVHTTEPNSWVTDNALYIAEKKEEFNEDYLAAALKIANLNQYANKSAQPLISGSRIYPVEILSPSIDMQKDFSRVLSKIHSLKEKAGQTVEDSDNLFNSLQQRAFRGELSLN